MAITVLTVYHTWVPLGSRQCQAATEVGKPIMHHLVKIEVGPDTVTNTGGIGLLEEYQGIEDEQGDLLLQQIT